MAFVRQGHPNANALIYAISPGNFDGGTPEKIDASSLVRICRNLIKIDEPVANLSRVRFAHSTIQEFLLRRSEFAVATSNQAIVSRCLQICTEGVTDLPSTDFEWMNEFYRYATLYWPLHYQDAPEGVISGQLLDFVFDDSQGPSFSFEEWMKDAETLSRALPRDHALRRDHLRLKSAKDADCTALFTICLFGLDELLDNLNSPYFSWDQRNYLNHTALYLASYHGHTRVVEYLVRKAVDVNADCSKIGGPLHIACFRGHASVVATLLHYGACPRKCSCIFDNAMEAAGRGGHEAVAQVLMENEALNLSAKEIDIAIKDAGTYGFFDVIAKLEALKTDRTQSLKRRRVMEAIHNGKTNQLRRMIQSDPELGGMLPSNGIAAAALDGSLPMLDFLLDKGLNIEEPGPSGTPLRTATLKGHRRVVEALLRRGANAQDAEAIKAASMKGHTPILRTLIKALKVDKKRRKSILEDSAKAATSHNQLEVLKYLADAGADIDKPELAAEIRDIAVQSGYERIVLFLMNRHKKTHGEKGLDEFPDDPTQGH